MALSVTKAGEMYIQISGDYTQFKRDLGAATELAKSAGKNISTALNNAAGPTQMTASLGALTQELAKARSMGKALVPFVFAFQPALLLVTDGFTWPAFFLAAGGAMLGIWALSSAITGWLFGPLWRSERALLVIAAILLVAPQLIATLIGIAIMAPIAARQLIANKRSTA